MFIIEPLKTSDYYTYVIYDIGVIDAYLTTGTIEGLIYNILE